DGAGGRADLHALDLGGQRDLLARMESPRIVDKRKADFHVLHFLRRVLLVPGVDGGGAALAIGEQEWQRSARHDRKASRLVAWVDVSEIGDAVARHVVMVERLAQLLGREQCSGESPVRGLLDVVDPGLQAGVQGMLGRHPAGKLECDRFVLGLRRSRGKRQCGGQRGDREREGGTDVMHGLLVMCWGTVTFYKNWTAPAIRLSLGWWDAASSESAGL